MNSPCRIGYINQEGNVLSSYCHHNENEDNISDILLNYYTDLKKVKELISLGNISKLGKFIKPTDSHSFKNPQKDVTVFYIRDRNDPEHHHLKIETSELNLYDTFKECQSFYLFKNGEWFLNNQIIKKLNEK